MSYFSTLSWENKLLFEWVSDCWLTPIELFFNFIMGEQVIFWVSDCCLMPIDLFFNFIMGEQVTFWVSEWLLFNANWAILSYFSTWSWENKLLFEWVSDCCLMPIELFFNFIMGEQVAFWMSERLLINANWAIFQLYHGRTSYFLSEWLLLNANWAIFQLYHGRTSYSLSEWLLLFNANSAIFQLYHDENKSIFNEIMMRSALN